MSREPLAPLRPEDAPDALIAAQTEDQPGAYSGPYEAGGVWAVVEGAGVLRVNGVPLAVTEPGCIQLIAHERHTAGDADARVGEGVTVHATCFTPGLRLKHLVPAVAEQADEPRRAVVVDDHRRARPVRRAVGLGQRKCGW